MLLKNFNPLRSGFHLIEGALPRVLLHRVLGWCVSHTKELLADWNLARQGKEPKWIDWTID